MSQWGQHPSRLGSHHYFARGQDTLNKALHIKHSREEGTLRVGMT